MAENRRRGGAPDPEALAALGTTPPSRLRKAVPTDVVSMLAGPQAVEPPVETAAPVAAPAPAPVVATPAAVVAPPAPKTEAKPAATEPEKVWPAKTSFYQSSEDGGRMRAAFVNSHIAEEVSSLSEFIGNAVAREVERVEALYNGGKPWPPIKPQQVPKGPPRRWTT